MKWQWSLFPSQLLVYIRTKKKREDISTRVIKNCSENAHAVCFCV